MQLEQHQNVALRVIERSETRHLFQRIMRVKILKRSRASEEDVFVEMAHVVREWASDLN